MAEVHAELPLKRSWALAAFLASDPVGAARIGQTPHEVVFAQGAASLRYFAPAPTAPARRPLFICMPLINTWTIFDLVPGRSIVEGLVSRGTPVYLLDWGRPGPEARETTLGELIDGVLRRMLQRSVRHARAQGSLGPEGLPDALGYCVGGTFLAICLARHPGLARRMALLGAPIDFHKSGRLSEWISEGLFPVDELVDGYGNFPARILEEGFALIRPLGRVTKLKTLWERVHDPAYRALWAAVERWNHDPVDFPGEAYREYVRRCYFENRLMTGGWELDGQPVDLSAAAIPAVAFGASRDHICPTPAAFGLLRAWGGPVQHAVVQGGHVGVCLGRSFPALLHAWLDQDAQGATACAP